MWRKKNGANSDNTTVIICDQKDGAQLAQVTLEGQHMPPEGPFRYTGLMRSFRLVDGNISELRKKWRRQTLLTVHLGGTTALVRVAALPNGLGSRGFLEFV